MRARACGCVLPLVLFLLEPRATALGQPPGSNPTGEGGRKQQAKELYDKGESTEKRGDYAAAVQVYRQALGLYPGTSQLHYRIGICQQALGQKEEAIASFRAVLAAQNDEPEAANARKCLDGFLLPKLTPTQRDLLDQASDNIEAASELLQVEGASAIPLRRAIALLLQLKKEVPAYLPLYVRLGTACQQAGDHVSAIQAYDEYLKGYEKLGYAPEDKRDVRKRRAVCDALAQRQQQSGIDKKQVGGSAGKSAPDGAKGGNDGSAAGQTPAPAEPAAHDPTLYPEIKLLLGCLSTYTLDDGVSIGPFSLTEGTRVNAFEVEVALVVDGVEQKEPFRGTIQTVDKVEPGKQGTVAFSLWRGAVQEGTDGRDILVKVRQKHPDPWQHGKLVDIGEFKARLLNTGKLTVDWRPLTNAKLATQPADGPGRSKASFAMGTSEFRYVANVEIACSGK